MELLAFLYIMWYSDTIIILKEMFSSAYFVRFFHNKIQSGTKMTCRGIKRQCIAKQSCLSKKRRHFLKDFDWSVDSPNFPVYIYDKEMEQWQSISVLTLRSGK